MTTNEELISRLNSVGESLDAQATPTQVRNALMRFQASWGLTISGVLDKATEKVLLDRTVIASRPHFEPKPMASKKRGSLGH